MKRSFMILTLALLHMVLSISLPVSFAEDVNSFRLPSDMPVVFVDPLYVEADLGETVTVSVKIFNLSNNCYMTNYYWEPGGPLPPPGVLVNYSLGNVFGFDIRFQWDSTVLTYINHVVKIPVEDYPDGILHEPVVMIFDDVDVIAGTYWLAVTSVGVTTPPFNSPDSNATIFDMTFIVKKQGGSLLNITNSELAVPITIPGYQNFQQVLPHRQYDGWLQTPSKLSTSVFMNMNPNPVGIGEIVTLKGILLDGNSQSLGNQTIRLYAKPLGGPFTFITTLVTNEYGLFTWQAAIPISGVFTFVAYYLGSEMYESSYNFVILVVQ